MHAAYENCNITLFALKIFPARAEKSSFRSHTLHSAQRSRRNVFMLSCFLGHTTWHGWSLSCPSIQWWLLCKCYCTTSIWEQDLELWSHSVLHNAAPFFFSPSIKVGHAIRIDERTTFYAICAHVASELFIKRRESKMGSCHPDMPLTCIARCKRNLACVLQATLVPMPLHAAKLLSGNPATAWYRLAMISQSQNSMHPLLHITPLM